MGQGILEFLEFRHCGIPSLRGFKKAEAISYRIPTNSSLRGFEKRGSNLIKSPSLRGSKATEAISLGHRHCERSEAISFIKSWNFKRDCFVVRFTHSSQ